MLPKLIQTILFRFVSILLETVIVFFLGGMVGGIHVNRTSVLLFVSVTVLNQVTTVAAKYFCPFFFFIFTASCEIPEFPISALAPKGLHFNDMNSNNKQKIKTQWQVIA